MLLKDLPLNKDCYCETVRWSTCSHPSDRIGVPALFPSPGRPASPGGRIPETGMLILAGLMCLAGQGNMPRKKQEERKRAKIFLSSMIVMVMFCIYIYIYIYMLSLFYIKILRHGWISW